MTVLANATTASAATISPRDCPSTYACWWVHIDYGGDYFASSKDQYVWPEKIFNKDSSVVNNGTSGKAIYTYNWGYQIETVHCVRKGIWVRWLGNSQQDKGQSHNWKAPDGGCL